ncbi:MAG: amino acid ABC transporter permease, partial [Anaeroplasmataceae bacterium]
MLNNKKERIIQITLLAIVLSVILILFLSFRETLINRFVLNFIKNDNYLQILKGLLNTFLITISGFTIGLFLGLLTCIITSAKTQNWFILILKQIFNTYVAIFRGTPAVVQLLIIYFIVFASYRGDAMFIAIIAFGLNSGAYISEIIRGGINAVPEGQMEAGRSLGLSYPVVMTNIVLPQAIKNSIPSLGNEFITLIKETSVVGFIAGFDLALAFRKIANATYDFEMVYIVMGVMYFVI